MECKEIRNKEMANQIKVLIETLWNVKLYEVNSNTFNYYSVLIETLWNVKSN